MIQIAEKSTPIMRSFAYLIPALLAGSASAAAISNAFQAGGISERQTGLIVGIYFYDAVSCPQSGAQTVTDDDQRCHSIVGNRYRSFNVPFIRKGCTRKSPKIPLLLLFSDRTG